MKTGPRRAGGARFLFVRIEVPADLREGGVRFGGRFGFRKLDEREGQAALGARLDQVAAWRPVVDLESGSVSLV